MNTKILDYLVVGAGPAGLQMAYFLEKAKRNYRVLESGKSAGTFFQTFPRHGKLISINKIHTGTLDPEFNLRHDWNSLLFDDPDSRFSKFSEEYFPDAGTYVEYLNHLAEMNRLKIQYNTKVEKVDKSEGDAQFSVTTTNGETWLCQNLLVATGLSLPMVPEIPGIESITGYEDMDINPRMYRNQRVLILGKGNSAFETADNLITEASFIHVLSPNPVKLAWETRFVGNLRAVNNNFIDTYTLKSQNAVIDANVEKITQTKNGTYRVKWASLHANDTEEIEYDRVIRCTGFRFDTAIFSDRCMPDMSECQKLPMMTSSWESTNIPGMFFLGAPTQALDYKVSQSAFIHGFRYNVRTLFHFLENRNNGVELNCLFVENNPESLAFSILERMNRVSSLWQQVGFLADMIVLPEDESENVKYYTDLPYQYIRENCTDLAQGCRFYIAMFRLGKTHGDSLSHERPSNLFEGQDSIAIHPVYEQYDGNGERIGEFHLLEDLLADWSRPDYVNAAKEYFKSTMHGKECCMMEVSETRNIVR
ncbi:NAD(P)-binding domain-containing protein [Teredinibacter turnerae]|uniref:NAD(P)-binding domain-containing protein n=1 Tax=Teredinibacter turnerae TaxID=2426 RepID=UPI0003677ABB|nr:NAD(P)-binding domain-containing protein [Teredinibacter turnerae]